MKNTTKAGTPATTAKKTATYALAARQAKNIDRLAWQLGLTPENTTRKLLDCAIRFMDGSMGEGHRTFDTGWDFVPTPQMEKMTRAEISALQQGGKFAQEVLHERFHNKYATTA